MFWPYHHTIYANQRGENQGAFKDDVLKAMAAALNMDQAAFDTCLDSERYRAQIGASAGEAQERQVRSTPTLFINGVLYQGSPSFDQINARIQAELAQ